VPTTFAELVVRYRALIRQIATFVGVGLTATAAHFAALTVLVENGLTGPVAGSGVGFVVGGIVSYSLNRRFTFESTRSHAGAVPRFMVVAGVAFVLNGLIMGLLVHELGIYYLLAQSITTGITMLWTFSGYRVWAFAHRTGARQA
jgi:putative flippase GtrA